MSLWTKSRSLRGAAAVCMSFQRLIIPIVLTFSTICRGEATNSFDIYLTAEPVDRRITAYGQGDWSRIRLAEPPLISVADIISYDFSNHVMKLKPEALARIPRPPVEGVPFIVVVNGERIYLGAFTTGESSMTFGVPHIMVDRASLVTNQPPDTLVVERAYPSPSFGVGPDPRGDQRIKTALTALHKLKNAEAAWGDPVDGVSVRLRADKIGWAINETPALKLDVRNQGQQEFSIAQSQESGRLQVDGVWYGWTGGFDLKGSTFPPGREYDDILVTLGSNWMAPPEWRDKTQAPPPQIPLKLLPGKHTIRFAPEIRDLTVKPKPQNIYVPSNPVEIRTTE